MDRSDDREAGNRRVEDRGRPAGSDERDLDEWGRAVMDGYDDLADAYDSERDPGDDIPLVESFGADLRPDARVLDAGCGGGRAVLETLAGDYDCVGLDLSATQLELAQERAPEAALVRGDMARLPFADDAFDAVCAFHSVIHVPRDHHEAVFDEFARVCRPGGTLLCTLGEGAWEGHVDDWLDGGGAMRWSFYGGERNRDLLAQAGFRVDDANANDDGLGGGQWLYCRATLDTDYCRSVPDRPHERAVGPVNRYNNHYESRQ